MKRIFICAIVFISAAMFTNASAQFRATDNADSQPKWGLSGQSNVEYYYLPDIATYYYVPRKQFIYQTDGHWTFSSSLPAAKKKYNLFSANKVVINEPGAYRYYDQHKVKYGSSQAQVSITKPVEKNSNNKNKQPRDLEKAGG
jgi:hypothetical protein